MAVLCQEFIIEEDPIMDSWVNKNLYTLIEQSAVKTVHYRTISHIVFTWLNVTPCIVTEQVYNIIIYHKLLFTFRDYS